MSNTLIDPSRETPIVLPYKDKDAILETLYEVGIPEEMYIVLGGANMVLRGIKPTTQDIDMLVSDEGFNLLLNRTTSSLKRPPARAEALGATNPTVWVHDSNTPMPISATETLGDGYYPMSFDEFKARTEVINNVPCLGLNEVIESKLALQRPKDIEDLKKIGLFLGKTIDLPEPTVIVPYIES